MFKINKSTVNNYIAKIYKGEINFFLYSIILVIAIISLHKYIETTYSRFIPLLFHFSGPFFLAFFHVIIITPLIIYMAKKGGILDQPRFRKKYQKKPTPLLGGISIFLSFLSVQLLFQPWTPQFKSILLGGLIILIMGIIDDIFSLSSRIRLGGQIVASFLVMSNGLIVSFMPSNIWGTAIACLITLLWILGIINATNFLDGADGLATGMTLIASTFFFLITLHLDQFDIAMMSVVLSGCCLGFLLFNFKPAKIYLGDSGSTFLGFLLACFALYGEWSSRGPVIALGIPILILGVLIFDLIYISVNRILTGKVKNFHQFLDYTGHDHFHHRLMSLGLSEKFAVIFIYLACILLGLDALLLENARISYPVFITVVKALIFFVLIMVLMNVENKKPAD